jgi:aminopeptidase N
MRSVLRHPALDPAFKAMVLALPSEAYVAEQLAASTRSASTRCAKHMRAHLAERLHADWAWAWEHHQVRERLPAAADQAGRRALANRALAMLCRHAARSGDPVWPGRAYQRSRTPAT